MLKKIDVHVLQLPSTNQGFWSECQQSLKDEPINLHVVDGIKGHIGKARYNGFIKGNAPYVSCVDPDDLVLEGAFDACLRALKENPDACGVYSDEFIINKTGEILKQGIWSGVPWNPLYQLDPKYLHHIYVMRREFVERCYLEILRWPSMPEYILKCMLTKFGPWVHVNQFGYKWRIVQNASHNKMSPTTVCAAQWRVIPFLQEAAKKHKTVVKTSQGFES